MLDIILYIYSFAYECIDLKGAFFITAIKNSITQIGFRRGAFLRGFMYDFIELFSPQLTRDLVDEAHQCQGKEELEALFRHLELPEY